jgi:AraC-like DNA-binding protein
LLYIYKIMIDIEAKRAALIASLTHLLDVYDITQVYYAEHGKDIPRGSNVSKCDRLAVPLSGCHRMEIFTGGQIETITPVPGTVTFMPIGIWNRPDWELPVQTATFGFEEDMTWVSIVENCGGGKNSGLRIVAPVLSLEGRSLLKLIGSDDLHVHNDVRSGLLVKALLYYCLDALRQVNDPLSHGKAYHTWHLITNYIEEHYATEISREGIGQLFKLAPNYISFLFKQQTGSSFIEYLNKLRLNKACFLLKSYNQTLDEVALAVGFSSAAYFCRLFKKYNGITPTEYRNRGDKPL